MERRQAQARWRVGVHDPLHQRRPGQAARGLCRALSGQRGGGGLDDVGGRLFCQKDSFLCGLWHPGRHRLHQRLGAGFFGGEGFILQKLEGDGLVFVHAGGTLIRRQLNGETLRVDTGCLVAFTDGIDYDVQLAGGLKSMLFGGEGLLLTTLKGSGTVWLQSLPFSRLAGRIYDATFAPAKR
ncbi:AIM24 family protein [Pseudomonas aeruginosa]|nr:AIM24 family protein [Pseudomonas aeruginosa]